MRTPAEGEQPGAGGGMPPMVEEVARLMREGLTVPEIARALGVSKGLVYQVTALLRGRRLHASVLELLRRGMTTREVASALNASYLYVKTIRTAFVRFGLVPRAWASKRRRCSEVSEDEVLTALDGCETVRCLHERLNVTVLCVESILRGLGVDGRTLRSAARFSRYALEAEREIRERCLADLGRVEYQHRPLLAKYLVERGYRVLRTPHYSPFLRVRRGLLLAYGPGCEEAVADHLIGLVRPEEVGSARRIAKWLLRHGADLKLARAVYRRLRPKARKRPGQTPKARATGVRAPLSKEELLELLKQDPCYAISILLPILVPVELVRRILEEYGVRVVVEVGDAKIVRFWS